MGLLSSSQYNFLYYNFCFAQHLCFGLKYSFVYYYEQNRTTVLERIRIELSHLEVILEFTTEVGQPQ